MPSTIGHALAGAATAWVCDAVPGDRAWRLAGPAASRFERAGGALTLVCAALAAAPDLDLLTPWHRTVTHSVGAVIFVALFSAAMAVNASRPILRVTAMCAGAYATHLVLDWLGTDNMAPFGIQALWPFSHAWFISHVDLFRQTARSSFMTAPVALRNLAAVVQEVAILGPIAWCAWSVRVKALAGLASEMSGGDHPPQQRAGAILGIAEAVEHHVENR
jgi:membrane-bound metal-dependent hydrolase YbcI (DUF457 family)